MRRPLIITPLVLPRSAIITDSLSDLMTAWKRLTLASFSTRSLALPRPMVTMGLSSSRMPFLPSGDEMISRDMRWVLLLFYEFVHIGDLALPHLDGAAHALVAGYLQNDIIRSGRKRPTHVRLPGGHVPVHDDRRAVRNGANVQQTFAGGNRVRAEESLERIALASGVFELG